MSPKAPAVHLARSPHAAVMTTWCGFDEVRSTKPEKAGTCRWDGGRIQRFGAFDCQYCRQAVTKELGRLKDIVGGYGVDVAIARELTNGVGCGDHSCYGNRPGGIGTNGGCRCEPAELRRAALAWRSYALLLERLR